MNSEGIVRGQLGDSEGSLIVFSLIMNTMLFVLILPSNVMKSII